MPYLAIAASVSPPPAMLNAFDAAIARAIVSVPAAKASNSNTPTGPFQTIVPADFSTSASAAAVSGPMSRIRSSASTAATAFTVAARIGPERLGGDDVGRHRHLGAAGAHRLADGTRLVDQRRLGQALADGRPAARRKVLAMPPPTISWSTLVDRLRRRRSLVETLLPATIATSGRAGAASARLRASISAASSGPAQASGANSAMP